MKIIMLGTGNALVTECYNTCFILSGGGKCENFLVDTGGGNGILHQLKCAGFALDDIHDIFISHAHIDHLLGLIWIIRISAQKMNKNNFDGDLNIYSHDEVISLIDDLAKKLLLPYQASFIGRRIHFHEVKNDDTRKIIGQEIKFFDIRSERTKQFGFVMNENFVFCGDEPLKTSCEHYAFSCDWLLHEAFCLHSQAEIFSPYEKHHSTVKDAAELAEKLCVKNLLLYHTEDTNILNRKELYTMEAQKYFSGKIFIPNDLESIEI